LPLPLEPVITQDSLAPVAQEKSRKIGWFGLPIEASQKQMLGMGVSRRSLAWRCGAFKRESARHRRSREIGVNRCAIVQPLACTLSLVI